MVVSRKKWGAREAAYLALYFSFKENTYIHETLEKWKNSDSPSSRDYNLAQEIAFGSARMALALDYIALQLSAKKKLNLKLKEKVLLRCAIYQHVYMDRIPLYAIIDESVKIALQYCHNTFTKFLNATLRRLANEKLKLPTGDSEEALSIRFSYPLFFVKTLVDEQGLETAMHILEAGNQPSPVMMRLRSREKMDHPLTLETPFPVAILKDPTIIPQLSKSPDYYFQNATPVYLMGKLCQQIRTPPLRLLDLCASPGGKILCAHDFFPHAELFANDISEKKIARLHENFNKYGIGADVRLSQGEEYLSDYFFDVIILDVPCSNSGVLNKRPEARWRLTQESLSALEQTQLKLIERAKKLLAPKGEIWLMTCSILKNENEGLVQKASELYGLTVEYSESVLPNQEGWDGGFAAILSLSHI